MTDHTPTWSGIEIPTESLHDAYERGKREERERCAQIAVSFGEFPGEPLIKDIRTMCANAIADKIRGLPLRSNVGT